MDIQNLQRYEERDKRRGQMSDHDFPKFEFDEGEEMPGGFGEGDFPKFDMDDAETAVMKPVLAVMGVGGAGCNTVNTMMEQDVGDITLCTVNTDVQALKQSKAEHTLQLGPRLCRGLGAGSNPNSGMQAARESISSVEAFLQGADMLFLTGGMGGGTGTGAMPIIAQKAQELGILTVGVVTKPFQFEGLSRAKVAAYGIECLRQVVDSLLIIPNQKLIDLPGGEEITVQNGFKRADQVLVEAVMGIADMINDTGFVNVDFADVQTVMQHKGLALMGSGWAEGPNRDIMAAEMAISSPLLDDFDISTASGVLVNITGGRDLLMSEVDRAVNFIQSRVNLTDEDAFKFGYVLKDDMQDQIKITIVATGFCELPEAQPRASMKAKVDNRQRPMSDRQIQDISTPALVRKQQSQLRKQEDGGEVGPSRTTPATTSNPQFGEPRRTASPVSVPAQPAQAEPRRHVLNPPPLPNMQQQSMDFLSQESGSEPEILEETLVNSSGRFDLREDMTEEEVTAPIDFVRPKRKKTYTVG